MSTSSSLSALSMSTKGAFKHSIKCRPSTFWHRSKLNTIVRHIEWKKIDLKRTNMPQVLFMCV